MPMLQILNVIRVCYAFTNIISLQEELVDATGFEVQFIPTLASNNWTPNPAWDGNMSLSSLESAPVLSVVGDTSVTVCELIF